MEAVLFYFGKMILTSGLMFLYYQLCLKDKTFHHYNRFYLLGTLLVSLLLPLLKVSYFTIEVNNNIYLLIHKLQQVNPEADTDTIHYPGLLILGFAIVAVLLTGRFVYGIFKIVTLKNRFPKEGFEGINFYQTDLDNAPFSYFRNLFWKNAIPVNSAAGKQILKHEMAHIEQKHTYDKVLIEIIRSVFWFNPFFHLIKKEMHLIHEYLADKKAIKQSDTRAFAQMLLVSHFSGNTFPAASPFLNTHLKKRLKMIQTSKTKFSYARKTLALPLLCGITFACVVHAQNRQIKAANDDIAQAISGTGKNAAPVQSGITAKREGTDAALSGQVKRSVKSLKQSDAKIAGLDQQIRERMEALKTLAPDTKAFAAKIEEISTLGKAITELVHTDDFKNSVAAVQAHALNYSEVLSKEDLEQIKEEAARAKEAGAAALEEAKIAMQEATLMRKEAALARQAAAQMREAATRAKEAAAMARQEAALAREQAERIRAQSKNR